MADKVIVLQSPSGRQYRTTNEAEAQHLQNTAGYKRATAYEAPNKAEAPAANKARTTKSADA